jgi:hypothetical protein
MGWVNFAGARLGAMLLLLLLYILGPCPLQYALVALLSLSMAWLTYRQRIKPPFAKKVALAEQLILVFLCAAASAWCGLTVCAAARDPMPEADSGRQRGSRATVGLPPFASPPFRHWRKRVAIDAHAQTRNSLYNPRGRRGSAIHEDHFAL